MEFLKSIIGPLLKLGLDGLDAFVVIALLVLTGSLFSVGMDQYLVAVIVLGLGGAYFYRRNRSDDHKERLAELEVEKIERDRGAAVREKARKRLARSKSTGRAIGQKRDEDDAANG